MIGVATQYVSKWLWGGVEGPADFSIILPPQARDRQKTKLHRWQSTGPNKLLPWGIVVQQHGVIGLSCIGGRLTLQWRHGEQGYTLKQSDNRAHWLSRSKKLFIFCGSGDGLDVICTNRCPAVHRVNMRGAADTKEGTYKTFNYHIKYFR